MVEYKILTIKIFFLGILPMKIFVHVSKEICTRLFITILILPGKRAIRYLHMYQYNSSYTD